MFSTAFFSAPFQHPPLFGDDFRRPHFHPHGDPFEGHAHEIYPDMPPPPFGFALGRGGRGGYGGRGGRGRGGGRERGLGPLGRRPPPPPFGAGTFDFTAHGPPHHLPPPPPSFDAGPFGFHPHGPPFTDPFRGYGGADTPLPDGLLHCESSPPHNLHHGVAGCNSEDRGCPYHTGEDEWEILSASSIHEFCNDEIHDTGHPWGHHHHGPGIHRPSSAPPECCRSPPPEAQQDGHDNPRAHHHRCGRCTIHASPFRHPHGHRGGPPGMRGRFVSPRGSACRRGGPPPPPPPPGPFHLHEQGEPSPHIPPHRRMRHAFPGRGGLRGGFGRGGLRGRGRGRGHLPCRCQGRDDPPAPESDSETETIAREQVADPALRRESVSEDHDRDREQADDLMNDKPDAGGATSA